MNATFKDTLDCLEGLILIDKDIEDIISSLSNNTVPAKWTYHSYQSEKPLASWITDFYARIDFFKQWEKNPIMKSYNLSYFFFPQVILDIQELFHHHKAEVRKKTEPDHRQSVSCDQTIKKKLRAQRKRRWLKYIRTHFRGRCHSRVQAAVDRPAS